MAAIALQQVGKVYPGGVAAVKDVSLSIGDGEFVVLVGPSGCGKSTTLRMIAGLEEIDAGTITIGGRVVNDIPPKDRDIAMVFQNYALYPHMSVYKNMAFALKLRKVPREQIDRRVRDAATMLGIGELLDRKPGALSGGQRQRVALGRAIVREPQAFLFDEPLSNLDARLRTTTRGELKALHQRLKTTTVYVTHDQEEAMTLGDRVVVMSGGQIQQVGTPLEVYRAPVNRFVAGFIGTPPMNFLDGTLARENGHAVFTERGENGARFTIPMPVAAAAQGAGVVCGIRPQSLSLDRAGNAFRATIEVIEPLGDQQDVICRTTSGKRIVARVPAGDGLSSGQSVALRPVPDRVHVFEEGDYGRSLLGMA